MLELVKLNINLKQERQEKVSVSVSEGSTNAEYFLLFQSQGLACNIKLLLGVSVQCLPGLLLRFTNKQIMWNRCNWHLILSRHAVSV